MDKSFALIIEGNRQAAGMYEHVLAEAGFQTEVVSNYADSLERLYKRPPWLLILDLDLPGIFGGKLLDTMRNDDRLRQIKVIAVTSFSQVAESLPVEPDLLLFKPVGAEQLADLLERFKLKIKFQTTIPMIGEPWDRVTGAYNQAFFMELLEKSLLQSREKDRYHFGVLAVSLDQNNRLKETLEIKNWINLLCAAAGIMTTTVRPTDTVARFDQDNFHILIENVPDNEILGMLATRLRKNLKAKLSPMSPRVQLAVKVGGLICDRRYENIEDILRDAGTARSLERIQGGNPAKYCEPVSVML